MYFFACPKKYQKRTSPVKVCLGSLRSPRHPAPGLFLLGMLLLLKYKREAFTPWRSLNSKDHLKNHALIEDLVRGALSLVRFFGQAKK